MKPNYKFAAGIIASLGLGLAVATAYANPGQMGGGMEHGKGGMQHGAQGGMKGGMGGGAQHGAGHQLMTPEERTALQEKMRNARTPEERQQIATATRTEMHKRAQEKGITPHEGRGPRTGTQTQAPASTEHQH
jgi:hypothetical protein